MKQLTRGILQALEWFFYGDSFDPPGCVVVLGVIAMSLLLVLFAPIWLPIWLLAKWCGYEWKQ